MSVRLYWDRVLISGRHCHLVVLKRSKLGLHNVYYYYSSFAVVLVLEIVFITSLQSTHGARVVLSLLVHVLGE